MQAGVVPKKFCRIDYQCAASAYDRAMRRIATENRQPKEKGRIPGGKRGRIVFWKDKLRELPAWKQPCLHHMIGHIDFRACTHDYHCADCEFDQYFSDQYTVHAVVRPVDVLDIKGFKLPHGYYLHLHVQLMMNWSSSILVLPMKLNYHVLDIYQYIHFLINY